MSDLYNRIKELCGNSGKSIGKMCSELGISRGNLSDLKMERIKTLKSDNLSKIAEHFGVTVDYLLGAEKETITEKKGAVTDDDIKFALFNGERGVTDAQYEEVKRFAAFIKERDRIADNNNKE